MLVSDLPVPPLDVDRLSRQELRKLPEVFADLPEPRRRRPPRARPPVGLDELVPERLAGGFAVDAALLQRAGVGGLSSKQDP